MTSTTQKIKPAKASKPAKAAPAAQPTKPAARALTPLDVLKPGTKTRDKTGTKQKVYDMVTRKGVTFRALLTAAEKDELPTARVKGWVESWVRRGYLSID